MIQLSIVVAVYNTEKFLGRCLDSLLSQEIPPEKYEIIVINDGSEGNCGEIMADYILRNPQIHYVEQTNKGCFQTRNVGANLSNGKYIYFIDSDDYITTNILGTIIAFMDEKKIDVFGFEFIKTKESTIKRPPITQKDFDTITIYDGNTFLEKFDYYTESVWFVANREYLLRSNINYHSGIGFSDALFTTESLFYARRVAAIPHILYAYFQHGDSILNNKSQEFYRQLLKRYEATSEEFTKFRSRIEFDSDISKSVIARIRSKEMKYIFFMLLRVVQSDLSYNEIGQMLERLKLKNYYPIEGFLIAGNSKFIYRLLLIVLNHKLLFYPAIFTYRQLASFITCFRYNLAPSKLMNR